MLKPIPQNELDSLDLNRLVQRMDELLLESVRERYGQIRKEFSVSLVSQVIATQRVGAWSDEEKRRIAYIAFDYLVEMELHSVSGGFANRILFTPEYDANKSWMSPTFRLREGAIRQFEIVSSRIAMEIFMDLLHCIETGRRVESERSKLKSFRKWLCNPTNQFHYFAHVLLEAYRFDRGLRTPEIHGTPKLPKRLLMLQVPDHQENNEPHRLINALVNCWRPLLEILNGQRPSYMHISEGEMDWFNTYMSGDEKEVSLKLAAMFKEVY